MRISKYRFVLSSLLWLRESNHYTYVLRLTCKHSCITQNIDWWIASQEPDTGRWLILQANQFEWNAFCCFEFDQWAEENPTQFFLVSGRSEKWQSPPSITLLLIHRNQPDFQSNFHKIFHIFCKNGIHNGLIWHFVNAFHLFKWFIVTDEHCITLDLFSYLWIANTQRRRP